MALPPTAHPRQIHPRSLVWTHWTRDDDDDDDGDDDVDDCGRSARSPRPSLDGPLRSKEIR